MEDDIIAGDEVRLEEDHLGIPAGTRGVVEVRYGQHVKVNYLWPDCNGTFTYAHKLRRNYSDDPPYVEPLLHRRMFDL